MGTLRNPATVGPFPVARSPHPPGAQDQLGPDRTDLRSIVLTHCHDDPSGSATVISSWHGASVAAGRAEAAFIRGEQPASAFELTPAEQALPAVVAADLEQAPSSHVDVELGERDVLDIAGGATVLGVPSHTPGSFALHLPAHGVLIAGDTITEHQGQIMLGPFNTDRTQAWASLKRLSALEVEIAGFGHGQPLRQSASNSLRVAIDPFA